jgi:hypothetical protein
MLWFVIALQAMTPFIHAHAGAVQLNHSGLLHPHQGVHGDAAYHAVVNGEHGAEVAVAQGMPASRHAATAGADADAPSVTAATLPAATAAGLIAALPSPPPFHLSPPDHSLPLALAPPRS